MWQLVFTKRAENDFFRLEKPVSKRILAKLESCLESPETKFSQVKGTEYRKIRIGDYRVLAVFYPEKKTVDVRRVGHRRNIYKGL